MLSFSRSRRRTRAAYKLAPNSLSESGSIKSSDGRRGDLGYAAATDGRASNLENHPDA